MVISHKRDAAGKRFDTHLTIFSFIKKYIGKCITGIFCMKNRAWDAFKYRSTGSRLTLNKTVITRVCAQHAHQPVKNRDIPRQ